jgi:hypothetical protein
MVPCPDATVPDARVIDSEVDTAAELELCRALVWAGKPTAAGADAFRAELPEGARLATTDDSGSPALWVAAPQDLFVLPSAQDSGLPLIAFAATITRVESVTGLGAQSPELASRAGAADTELAELAAALGRARSQGGTP